MNTKTRRPPAHLSREAKSWFRAIAEEMRFDNAAEWQLLADAAGCLERIDQSRVEIQKHGLLVPTGQGSWKPNPAVNIERDNRILFARLCRELRLVEPSEDESNRIPRNR